MSLLTRDRLNKEVGYYYKKCRDCNNEARHTGKADPATRAYRYECIADTLKASAAIPGLRDKVALHRCLVSTIGNRVRLVRLAEGEKGLTAAYKLAMELLELVEEIAERDGLIEEVSLGEAKVEGEG